MLTDLFDDKDNWKKYSSKELLQQLPDYFEWSGDIEKSAYLNWRFDFIRDLETQFYEMGKAYFETAIVLVDECIKNNCDKKADIWIFPILFNTVHGIEIYLKGFNSQIKVLDKIEKQQYQDSKIEGAHNILQLCQLAISLINQSSKKELLSDFEFVKKFIEILYMNTNDMTFARYPITNKGKNHFYVDKHENITIDLDVFRVWLCKVFEILDGCTGFIDFQIEKIKELLNEVQQTYGE